MIYYVLRFYARMGLWANFRHIYLEGFEHIPEHYHVIFGLNHPTAFIDPIALGTHVDAPCWYMLRGDKFVNRPVRWFLHQIQNLPIWRERDGGRAAVRKNIQTMSYATDKVVEGEPTIILSEGLCKHERRLRTIQRGTARMMFQAWKKDKAKPVCIVPVAANYTESNAFRSHLTLTASAPIYAADYVEAFRADSRETVDVVTAELERRLRATVIHVEDRKRDGLVDKLLPLVQHSFPDIGYPPVLRGDTFTRAQHAAVEAVNAMESYEANAFESELDDYLRRLTAADVTDSGVAYPEYGSMARAVGLWLLGPIATLGFLIYFPAAGITQRRTEKMVSNPQFFSSVRFGIGLVVNVVYLLVATLLAGLLFGWFALVIPVLFPLLGYFYLVWWESFTLWRKAARTKSLSDGQLARFRKERADLLRQVGVAASAPAGERA